MRAYICTHCSSPCYLIDTNELNEPEIPVIPDTCPFRSDANWNETTIEDMKRQLEVQDDE